MLLALWSWARRSSMLAGRPAKHGANCRTKATGADRMSPNRTPRCGGRSAAPSAPPPGAPRRGREPAGLPFPAESHLGLLRDPYFHGLADRNPDDFDPAGGFQRNQQRCGNRCGPERPLSTCVEPRRRQHRGVRHRPEKGTLTTIQHVATREKPRRISVSIQPAVTFGRQSGFQYRNHFQINGSTGELAPAGRARACRRRCVRIVLSANPH